MTLGATPTALGAIQTAAKARGLAWAPLAAVAHFESGLNPQSIGDGGHAFGLFQNNNAGGTITGDPNPRRFLNPTVSANYTADAIKRLGIQGLPPAQQVAAIVSRYERPANPGREIAGAQQYLQTLGAGAASPATPALPSAPVASAQSLPAASLAPLQAGLGLQQQTNQRALDALGKLSGRSVQAAEAPNLATLTASTSAQLQPTSTAPKAKTVPLSGKIPAGLDTQEAKALELARHYIGTAYHFGGASPKTGFDCSGLVQWANAQVGVKVPRTAAEQFQVGKHVALNQLQPGDAVFFRDASGIHHVGMYVGGPKQAFLESPHTGDVVKIASLQEPYYAGQFAGGRRFA